MEFTKTRLIGQGGFGEVFEVHDEKSKLFALKTFKVNQGPHFPPEMIEHVKKRFVREAKIQENIKHKNVVPIIAKNLYVDPPYFVMPLALGSLHQDIENDTTLGGNHLEVLMDILAGLEELHSIGIFHRDLKPANILRFTGSKNERRNYYALSDFGLMSVRQTQISALTQTGMRMGSDYYTAPEIVADLRRASAQSDIYSVGCILHDLVGTEPRVPCNEIHESGDYSGILISCTRKDPRRRFKSVVSLRDSLLSLDAQALRPNTEKGERILSILNSPNPITERDWEKVITFIEDLYDSYDSRTVLERISFDQIDFLVKNFPLLRERLGLIYSRWVRETSFRFELCDVLATRLELFIQTGDINIQAECLMAMLYMGTRHNRWFVERKFIEYTNNTLNENLCKRLAIEIRTDGETACEAIKHLINSVGFQVQNFHPLLHSTFTDICK